MDEPELNFSTVISKDAEKDIGPEKDNNSTSKNRMNDIPVEERKSTSPLQKVASIKELSTAVTRKISTGQVVISLAGACRELIDNSLDAGATNIEIRVKENGVDSIEVIDNGCGIENSNFELLCKAHSTSKLSAISDFNSLSTFGFRGEALNALAALSELSITTRHSNAKVGTRMTFDKDGRILKQENCPRQVGTSVIIAKLFYSLPVRRQEFQRSSRKEFMKMLSCVQSFALSRACRFNCLNMISGKLNQVLSSPGNVTVKETIACLFGSKFEKGNIIEIQQALPSEEICAQYGLRTGGEDVFHKIGIHGMVSSSNFGEGRSAPDRQFIYVNMRPVDVPKLNRIANEVYSSFNHGRYCMLVLFITVDSESIDVNVSPDKRTVFFQHEKELFAKFRASLLATFAKISGNCPRSDATPTTDANRACETTRIVPQTQLSDDEMGEMDDAASVVSSQLTPTSRLPESPNTSFQFDNRPFRTGASGYTQQHPTSSGLPSAKKRQRGLSDVHDNIDLHMTVGNMCKRRDGGNLIEDLIHYKFVAENVRKPLAIREIPLKTLDDFSFCHSAVQKADFSLALQNKFHDQEQIAQDRNYPVSIHDNCGEAPLDSPATSSYFSASVPSSDVVVMRPQQNLVVNMEALRLSVEKKFRHRMHNKETPEVLGVQKSSDMTDENQPEELAEQHLSVMLDKDAFANMELVGQFNNSFIITRLKNQIFMIDQHASDEKHNFESLQRTSRITAQKLIHPQKLQLSAVQENVLHDNLDVLRGNGFDFTFDDQEPIGNRVWLASVPVLQGCNFNSDDVDEILAFLIEFPGCFYRPRKLRRIFASKACRSSVMFGKALTVQQMEAIVRAMGTMDSPWNCPHGRPTIRHLCSMDIEENTA